MSGAFGCGAEAAGPSGVHPGLWLVRSRWCGLRDEPDYSLHVVDEIGQPDLGSRSGKADGADIEAIDPSVGQGRAQPPRASRICGRWPGRSACPSASCGGSASARHCSPGASHWLWSDRRYRPTRRWRCCPCRSKRAAAHRRGATRR
jgi:hypothetical protein